MNVAWFSSMFFLKPKKKKKKKAHCCRSPAYLIQKPALWIWMVTCQCPFPYQTPQVSAIFSTAQHVTHLSDSYQPIILFLLFFGQPLNYVSLLDSFVLTATKTNGVPISFPSIPPVFLALHASECHNSKALKVNDHVYHL